MSSLSFKEQVKAAERLWSVSPSECISALQSITASNAIEEVNRQRALVVHNEWAERINRGFMPYHCATLDDLGFHFTDLLPYGKAAKESGSAMDIACYLMLRGERETSERLFRIFEQKGHVAGATVFDPEFHTGLDVVDPSVGLPPVDFHNQAEGEGPVIYLACDHRYLAFALPMIRSLYAVAPEARCHLHIFNPEDGVPTEFPQLGLSSERCPAHKGYYHAVRFIRLNEFAASHEGAIWLMDVDGLFNRHPQPLFDTLGDFDVALRARPGRLEPWNQLNACVVGFNATPNGRKYLLRIAQYIRQFVNFLAWGIDQTAMFCVFDQIHPSITCLGEDAVDYDYRETGIVWANSSNVKKAHLLALTDPTVKIERPEYFEKFRQFALPTDQAAYPCKQTGQPATEKR